MAESTNANHITDFVVTLTLDYFCPLVGNLSLRTGYQPDCEELLTFLYHI